MYCSDGVIFILIKFQKQKGENGLPDDVLSSFYRQSVVEQIAGLFFLSVSLGCHYHIYQQEPCGLGA